MAVLNRHHDPHAVGVSIGRGTKWGNDYVIGRDGTRDQCIDRFEVDVRNNPELMAAARVELKGQNLICSCAPRRCHGDVWDRIANEVEGQAPSRPPPPAQLDLLGDDSLALAQPAPARSRADRYR
jgi:hypothetical protein